MMGRYILCTILFAVVVVIAVTEFWVPLIQMIIACGGDCRASIGGR